MVHHSVAVDIVVADTVPMVAADIVVVGIAPVAAADSVVVDIALMIVAEDTAELDIVSDDFFVNRVVNK